MPSRPAILLPSIVCSSLWPSQRVFHHDICTADTYTASACDMVLSTAKKEQLRRLHEGNRERNAEGAKDADKENNTAQATSNTRKSTKAPSLRVQFDSVCAELHSVQFKLSISRDTLSAAQATCQSHEHTIMSLNCRIESLQAQINALNEQLADSEAIIEALSTDLATTSGELRKTAARVTRLKHDREKAKEGFSATEAALLHELEQEKESLNCARDQNYTLDAQLAAAKLKSDELGTAVRRVQKEREKFKKRADRAKPALVSTRKALKALQIWNPMDGQMYNSDARRLFRRLDAAGVSSRRMPGVLMVIFNELGIKMKRRPSPRLIRMAVKEGGVLSEVQLGSEIARSKGKVSLFTSSFGLSSDGTTIKRVNYEARHLTLRTPDYKNPDTTPVFKTRVLDLNHAHDHTAVTQLEGDLAAGAAITNAYRNSPIYDAEGAPLDTDDFLRKQKWQNMDHAKDGKKKLDLMREAKLHVVKGDLGKEKWAELAPLDRFNATCAVSEEDLEDELGQAAILKMSALERDLQRESIAIQRLGDTAFNALSAEDQRRTGDILFAGCMCHKDLNTFKYAVNAVEAMWDKNSGPVLLANKANDAVIRLSKDPNSAAVQNALESSTRGALKLVSLAAMTFRNSNDITGYQHLGENFVELRKRELYPDEVASGLMNPAEPFPDFQRSRFQTGGQGAAELFLFLDIYLDLVRTIINSKMKTAQPNHIEANLLKGFECLKTQTELAAVSLYAVCGSESGGLINILDTVELHRSLAPFCQKFADDPDALLNPATPDSDLTIDGQPFMNSLVVAKIRKRAAELPRLKDVIRAVFSGGVTGWGIFTEEFEEGGPIDKLTEQDREDININSTNDSNEGLLGYTRKQKQNSPSGTIGLFAARAMYRRNDTEDFISAHANNRDLTLYAIREACKRDASGSNKEFREERAKRLIARATENKARRDKRLQEEAERRAKLLAAPVITATAKLDTLTLKQLNEQMRIHWRIHKDPVLTTLPNKSVLKRKSDMLSAVKGAVERYLTRMENAERQRLESEDAALHDDDDTSSESDPLDWDGFGDGSGMNADEFFERGNMFSEFEDAMYQLSDSEMDVD
ncbi:hypothetical protein GGX14DRAFT_625342 [Mycena pura]|uniref:Uncharacterized protein n=1 Tax=Mycena pura TaxID=153505 RepID=A0AAD6VE33_9AGAR|nr:hypothetical protein GGX14DRAFT_625342 [Mycena pura]